MILAIDTSSAACSIALIGDDGALIDARDEMIGRGHAERLVPLIDEMLAGRVPTQIAVGVGPGSFTGLRVGIAAAQGLAIGWSVPLSGVNSLALLAAAAADPDPDAPSVAAAVLGGHGELFVQGFRQPGTHPVGPPLNLSPDRAAAHIAAPLVIGNGAGALVAARGNGTALDGVPSASRLPLVSPADRSLPVKPLYVRPPDAQPAARSLRPANPAAPSVAA